MRISRTCASNGASPITLLKATAAISNGLENSPRPRKTCSAPGPPRSRKFRRRADERRALAALGRADGRCRTRLLPIRRAHAAPQHEPRRRSSGAAGVAGAAEISRRRRGRAAHQAARCRHAARPPGSRAHRSALRHRFARLRADSPARQRSQPRSRVLVDDRQGQQAAHRARLAIRPWNG